MCEEQTRESQKTFSCFLFFLAFSHLHFPANLSISLFPSHFRKFQAFFTSTIWRVKYCTKTWHFQILISFSLCSYQYCINLSSRPLPAQPLFPIVLHNGRKNIHVRKTWFVTWHQKGGFSQLGFPGVFKYNHCLYAIWLF